MSDKMRVRAKISPTVEAQRVTEQLRAQLRPWIPEGFEIQMSDWLVYEGATATFYTDEEFWQKYELAPDGA